jgi:hypothetical protein
MPFFNILYYLLTIITNIHVFGNFYLYNNNSSHEINTNFATIDPEATVGSKNLLFLVLSLLLVHKINVQYPLVLLTS